MGPACPASTSEVEAGGSTKLPLAIQAYMHTQVISRQSPRYSAWVQGQSEIQEILQLKKKQCYLDDPSDIFWLQDGKINFSLKFQPARLPYLRLATPVSGDNSWKYMSWERRQKDSLLVLWFWRTLKSSSKMWIPPVNAWTPLPLQEEEKEGAIKLIYRAEDSSLILAIGDSNGNKQPFQPMEPCKFWSQGHQVQWKADELGLQK